MDNIRNSLNTLIAWNHRQPDARLAYADAEMTTHFDTRPAPWLSLFLLVKGKMIFKVGDCTQTVTRGQLVFLNAHFGNSGIMQTDSGLYACLSFNAGRSRQLHSMRSEPLLMVCGIRDVDYVYNLCKRACTLAHMPPAYFPHIQVHAAVLEALTAVYEAVVPPDVTTAPGTSRVVRETMRIIHESHADPNLDLVRMAEKVGVSVGHLMKCFLMEGVGTPMHRLCDFRMARARTLLLRTDSPIRDIACATGFRDPLYFSRVFRRSTGTCPSEFRQGAVADRKPGQDGEAVAAPDAKAVSRTPRRRKAAGGYPYGDVNTNWTADIESVVMLETAIPLARDPVFEHADWFQVQKQGGVAYLLRTPPVGAKYMTVDLLIGDTRFITFQIRLLAGGREIWSRHCSALTWCQTRIVLKLPATADLANGDRVELIAARKPAGAMAFCAAPPRFSVEPPARLEAPALPKGPLLDEMGQFRLTEWQTKTRDANDASARLHADLEAAPTASWPARYSRFGGDRGSRTEATGFFRTHHDGRRWWLADPEGHRFWSAGACCVHPSIDHEVRYETEWMNLRSALAWMPNAGGEYAAAYGRNPWHAPTDRELDFVAINFIRAFGPDRWRERWETLTFAALKTIGMNTAGDWSDHDACRRAGFPYTRPLELHLRYTHTPMLVGKLPDVFHDGLAMDAAAYAEQLRDTADDPAMVGYFMHNEPGWWFGDGHVSPAEQMLFEDVRGHSRDALSAFLRKRYPDDDTLRRHWGNAASFAAVAEGAWVPPLTEAALRDLHAFSTILLGRMIGTLSKACRKVDPHHLNLGVRWWTFPPLWALAAMASVDVISFNCYQAAPDKIHYGSKEVQPGAEELCAVLNKPFMIGEWHIGAMDGGLPSAGLYGVRDQDERGKAYRVYLEQAAALPWCVGTHWFNLYDRNALYCPQANENYHAGFMDITQRRHETLCVAARKSHERLYDVASGLQKPYRADVKYLFPSR